MLNILITFGLLHHAPYTFVNPESTVNNPLGKRSFFLLRVNGRGDIIGQLQSEVFLIHRQITVRNKEYRDMLTYGCLFWNETR